MESSPAFKFPLWMTLKGCDKENKSVCIYSMSVLMRLCGHNVCDFLFSLAIFMVQG